MPDGILILLLICISVLFITILPVSNFETKLRHRFSINRIWWVPIVALGGGYLLGVIAGNDLLYTLLNKGDILLILLCLAIMAGGLSESGLFSYIGYRIAQACNGDSFTLFMGGYLAISAATFFTTNDVVIFVITPIILSICHQGRVKGGWLLLLIEFVAANTLSMVMFLGSPTNIIMASAVKIDFLEYIRIMAFPSTIIFILTTILTFCIIRLSLYFQYIEKEFKPINNPKHSEITNEMVGWAVISVIALMSIRLVSLSTISIGWAALGGSIIFMGYTIYTGQKSKTKSIIAKLPYGIFLFGFAFFTLTYSLMQTPLVQEIVLPYIQETFTHDDGSAFLFFVTGILVNLFNDLPAATMLGELFMQANLPAHSLVFQTILVGLNIACYITPIGALAGIIWFSFLHKFKRENPDSIVKLPNKYHLLIFGSTYFFLVGLPTILILKWL